MCNINYWNKKYENLNLDNIYYDGWFDDFRDEINNCKSRILDLGSGNGSNIKGLLDKNVIPCDISIESLNKIKQYFPNINNICYHNFMNKLPFNDGEFQIIIADLSLQYFDNNFTKKILFDIKRVLKQNGVLIFRLNSINDINYMSDLKETISNHYYLNNDDIKIRYFSFNDICEYFGNGIIEHLEETNVKQKTLWKGLVRY